jgi:hypothetical protein
MFFAVVINGAIVLALVWAVVHMRRQRQQNQHRELMISRLSGLALGSMVLGFQAIVQPQVQHMIVEEQQEDSVDDENGQPLGGRAFYDQLRRIRSGEEVEELTVRVAQPDPPDSQSNDPATSVTIITP